MVGDWSVTIERHGIEQQPIIVIDGFARDPDRFTADAQMLGFSPMGIHYPGVRATMPTAMVNTLVSALGDTVYAIFGFDAVHVADALYSLVTTQPDALTPIQRIPHFDGVEPSRLALLHYLSPDAPGGTAFYRHRSTQFESVTAERLPEYRTTLEADLAEHGMPDARYIDESTAVFDCIARIQGRHNRAILYHGNSLHCAWLPPGTSFSTEPDRGRLTANIFLEGQELTVAKM
jgi:hypothetical protein